MTIAVLVAGILGLVAGPVLHHLGVRAAVRAPFDGPVPRCETCDTRRTASGWFALRCRRCGARHRRREPAIWALSAAGAAGAALVAGVGPLLPAYLAFVAFTTVLVVTDLDAFLLPNRVLYPGTLVSVALLGLGALATSRLDDLLRGFGVGAVYLVALALIALLLPHGFGMGDAKMALLLGTFAGFSGWNAVATMLLYTALLGGLPAWFLLITRRAGREDHLPYGPAMILGTWLALALDGRLGVLG